MVLYVPLSAEEKKYNLYFQHIQKAMATLKFLLRDILSLKIICFILISAVCYFSCPLKNARANSVIDFQTLINFLPVPADTNLPYVPPVSIETSESAPAFSVPYSDYDHKKNPVTFINIPEPTDELFHSVLFNPLLEGEPILTFAEDFSMTFCISYKNVMAMNCSHENNFSDAVESLAENMINNFRTNVKRPFKIILPATMPTSDQLHLLREIEKGALIIVNTKLPSDLLNQKGKLLEGSPGWIHIWSTEKSIHYFNFKNYVSK